MDDASISEHRHEDIFNGKINFLSKRLSDNDRITGALLILLYSPFISNLAESLWDSFFLPGAGLLKYLVFSVFLFLAMPGIITALGKRFALMVSLSAIFMFLCMISSVLVPEIRAPLLLETEIRFIIFGALSFVLVCSIDDISTLWAPLTKASWLISACGLLFYLSALFFQDIYSMSFSYAMLIPIFVLTANFFRTHKWYNIAVPFLLLLMVFTRGSRGVLASLLAAILLCSFNWIFSELKKRVRSSVFIAILTFLAASITLIVINLQKILSLAGRVLNRIGLEGRTVSLFSQGNSFALSGRDGITESLFHELDKNPFAFHGIYGSGVVAGDHKHIDMTGMYAHDIVLELIFTFGIVVGIILFAIISCMVIFALFRTRTPVERNLVILFIASGLVPSFISNLVWTFTDFWILMGICTGVILREVRDYRKNKTDLKVMQRWNSATN